MRIRTIKPEFFLHEGLFTLEKETKLPVRLAFIGLWCAADRDGRFKWEPRRLGIQIMPYDTVDFSRVLDALTTRGFVVKYASGTAFFGFIPSFGKHQIINNREKESELPDPSESKQNQGFDACPTRAPRDNDDEKASLSGREGKGREQGKEGNGTDEGRNTTRPPRQSASDEDWILSLEADKTYEGIEIRRELGKMQRWCETKKKHPSRARFINWLNNADRTIGIQPLPTKPIRPADQSDVKAESMRLL